MKVEILPSAIEDLAVGFAFYEQKEVGLGDHFLDLLDSAIDSLKIYGGVHEVHFGRYHRKLADRFPWAVYYTVDGETAKIHAVLDCRRDPKWIRAQLQR